MGFVKGTDGIPRTVRNPLEGSVGDIALNDVAVTTLSASANVSTSGNLVAVGNVTGGNLVATALVRGATVQATGNLTGGNANISNGVFATTGGFGGNVSVGNISTGGQVFATGNITGGNILGNGASMSGVTTTQSGTWNVVPGTNNYSFTVPINNTYQLWVFGNIPNGIIVYNATVSVSNTNVPVIGQQFAWNYTGGGNPILLTSIPAQIIGTAGTISNASPAVGTTTNTFTFGINNSTAGNVTVNWGYSKIS